MPPRDDEEPKACTRHNHRHPDPRAAKAEQPPDGPTTAVLVLDVAPGFRPAARTRLLDAAGVIAVAPDRQPNRLRVQVVAADPHALQARIDGEVKRVPGVHRCRRLAGDGSRLGSGMWC